MRYLLGVIVALGIFNPNYASDSQTINVQEEFTIELSDAKSRYILYAGFLANDDLVFVFADTSEPFETYINMVTLDLKGKMRSSYKFSIQDAINLYAFYEGDDVILGWLETGIMTDGVSRLWIGKLQGDKLQKRLILEERAQETNVKANVAKHVGVDLEPTLLGKWWLLKVGCAQKLFIRKTGYKSVRSKDEIELSPTEWLYCYELNDRSLKLEGKVQIDGDFECCVDGNEVLIWQIVPEKEDVTDTLRVAVWERDGKLKWANCYTGNKPMSFWHDSSHGSGVMISEWKNPVNASGILSLIRATNPIPVPMCSCFWGGGIDGQLLRISDGGPAWVAAYTAMTSKKIIIIRVDEDMHAVSGVLRKSFDILDYHLIYHRSSLYLAMTTKTKLIVRKISAVNLR